MSQIKTELSKIKNKIISLKEEIKETSLDIKVREFKYNRMKGNLDKISKTQKYISLNIGGKIFQTTKETLQNVKNSLLASIVEDESMNLDEEIYIDRSPALFHFILNYYRYGTVNYNQFKNKQEIISFKNEAEFYQLIEILDYMESRMKEIIMLNFTFSGPYVYNGLTAGTNRIEHINNEDGLKGICAVSAGWIIIELNEQWDFSELTIGGWRGNKSLWYSDNGSGADISTSVDKVKWVSVGKIPTGYGTTNKSVKLTPSTAKFIKFSSSSYVGIGYLKISKRNSLFD